MSRIRILPTVSALILTFTVLFGGFQMYKNYELIRPLQAQLYKIQSVQSVHITTSGQMPTVNLQLGRVADLQTTYNIIVNAVTSTMGSPASIALKDHSSLFLRSTYETLKPTLFEGLAKGNYTSMIHSMESSSAKAGIACRVTMDTQYVYVQMSKGGFFLYAIVPYTIKTAGVSVQ